MAFIKGLARWLVGLAVVFVCAVSVAAFFEGRGWLLHLTVHFPIQLAALAAGLLVLTVVMRMRLAAILTGLCLIVQIPALIWTFVPPQSVEADTTRAVTITTMNVNLVALNPRAFTDYLNQSNPDFLLLQDAEGLDPGLVRLLSERFGHFSSSEHFKPRGKVLFSRQPITDFRRVPIADSSDYYVYDVTLDGQPLMLANVHTPNPTNKQSYLVRNAVFASLAEWAQSQSGPVVIAGDLNSTPWSSQFQDLVAQSGLKPVDQGQGLTGTWPSFLGRFGLPIDHILVPENVAVAEVSVGPDLGSDHRPFTARLRWPDK